jgi:hypothetical protein
MTVPCSCVSCAKHGNPPPPHLPECAGTYEIDFEELLYILSYSEQSATLRPILCALGIYGPAPTISDLQLILH